MQNWKSSARSAGPWHCRHRLTTGETVRSSELVMQANNQIKERVGESLEASTINRIYWRIIPLFFAMMFFNYLDRINIGFAGLRMNADLGFGPAVFGFGASIFFLGYMVLEVPSNLMLHWVGARVWLARILMTWGAVATCMAFVSSAWSFYLLRFGLGVAEAGFMPGLVLYLTYWFPARYRARAIAGYIIAGAFSAVLGGPISTTLMTYLNGLAGLHGWQWMFIAEGVPTILLGVFTLYYLTDRPADATWLTPAQRQWLQSELQAEIAAIEREGRHRLMNSIRDVRVWLLAALFGCALVGIYGMLMWLPQIIKSLGTRSDIEVGFLSAVPPLLGWSVPSWSAAAPTAAAIESCISPQSIRWARSACSPAPWCRTRSGPISACVLPG